MERFMLFAGDRYYPSGGAADYVGSFETFEAAQAAFIPENASDVLQDAWANIFDTDIEKIVAEYNFRYKWTYYSHE